MIIDDLSIEGLAAQLYEREQKGGICVWWHLLRLDLKDEFRRRARFQIQEYAVRNAAYQLRMTDIAP